MNKEYFGVRQKILYNTVSLDDVTAATDGVPVNSGNYESMSVFVQITGNTGAVDVNIEASATGAFAGEEFIIDTNTYTATNTTDVYSTIIVYPHIRVTTTTQTTSTVKATIIGRN